jgi:hypothetical protein
MQRGVLIAGRMNFIISAEMNHWTTRSTWT